MNDLNLILTPAAALFGLILGSFFNVIIYRLPLNLSIAWPPSHCPACNRPIRPIENIPVISYLFLCGKCAGCKGHISSRYPIVEIVTCCMTLILWKTVVNDFCITPHRWWEYLPLCIQIGSVLILIPVSLIDYDHYIIPDGITIYGALCGIAVSFLPGGMTPLEMFYGILAGGGSLLAIGLLGELILRKEAMGLGDVKLMAFIGSLWGWKIALMAIVFASFLGSIIGGGLILSRVMKRERPIPFGPFLSAGVVLAIFWGEKTIVWYFALVERVLIR
jgi:leader peptidase (prepilin peptidase)/N-methyltransferase